MKCGICGRTFTRRHKVTTLCLKCKHLQSRGREYVPNYIYNASCQKITQKSVIENPLLDWIDKKI